MAFRKTLFACAVLACLLTGKAVAADYYVDVTNHTGFTILYMYVSPGDANSWEEDVLGADVLADGMTQRVTLNNYNSPIFDVRLVDEDGDTYSFWNIDTSRHDLVVTLDHLD